MSQVFRSSIDMVSLSKIDIGDTIIFATKNADGSSLPLRYVMGEYRPESSQRSQEGLLFKYLGIRCPATFCAKYYRVESIDFQDKFRRFPERMSSHLNDKSEMHECLAELFRLVEVKNVEGEATTKVVAAVRGATTEIAKVPSLSISRMNFNSIIKVAI